MGCFLACFGFKEKKKRRQPGKKSPTEDNQCYVPLDSDVSIKLDIKENLKEKKPEEPSILKLKKKVRFNLNVKAYEPIPDNDDVGVNLSEGEEETKFDAGLHYEEDAIASSIASYPATYRYQNCRDSDDEEDQDLEDLDQTEESDEEEDDDVTNPTIENTSLVNLVYTEEKSQSKARDRSRYVSSVLNPVENLSQWRVVKAKAATPQLKLQKENSNDFDHTRHGIAVDASLTNWLSL